MLVVSVAFKDVFSNFSVAFANFFSSVS